MISFVNEYNDSFEFDDGSHSRWLSKVISLEGQNIGDICIVFCSDEYLLGINKKYLNHDYYTDVITFDYCEGNVVSGDIMISVDRVFDNSISFKKSKNSEMKRVLVHGVLHLLGYGDKSKKDIDIMRSKESLYMDKFDLVL